MRLALVPVSFALFGPFTCKSKTTGLTCSNRSGHGFTLNRTRYKLF